MGKPILETLAAYLKDTSSAVSQQQFKPMATPAAKLSFTAIAKKLMLHDSSEGCPQSCAELHAFTVWAAAAPQRAVVWNTLQLLLFLLGKMMCLL